MICVTYHSETIAENPEFSNWDVIYTSNNQKEFSKQLKLAYAITKRFAGDNCKNSQIPSLIDLTESKTGNYTLFIRY
jgi:hypothetical protein